MCGNENGISVGIKFIDTWRSSFACHSGDVKDNGWVPLSQVPSGERTTEAGSNTNPIDTRAAIETRY